MEGCLRGAGVCRSLPQPPAGSCWTPGPAPEVRTTGLLLGEALQGARDWLLQLPEGKQKLSLFLFQITVKEKVWFWIFVTGHSIKKMQTVS